jgi:hypothetical protein
MLRPFDIRSRTVSPRRVVQFSVSALPKPFQLFHQIDPVLVGTVPLDERQ